MKKELIIMMYRLNTTSNIKDITYDQQDVILFCRDYSLDERRSQFATLEWAMNNSDYDFKSISPIFKDLKFSNDEIYNYLSLLYQFMKENDIQNLEKN